MIEDDFVTVRGLMEDGSYADEALDRIEAERKELRAALEPFAGHVRRQGLARRRWRRPAFSDAG